MFVSFARDGSSAAELFQEKKNTDHEKDDQSQRMFSTPPDVCIYGLLGPGRRICLRNVKNTITQSDIFKAKMTQYLLYTITENLNKNHNYKKMQYNTTLNLLSNFQAT